MNADNEHIYSLIYRHLAENISEAEASMLKDWLDEDLRNQAEFDEIAELWDRSGNFQFGGKINIGEALSAVHKKSGIRPAKVFNIFLIRQIAAVLALSVLFSGLYSYFLSGESKHPVYYEEVQAVCGTRTNIELPDGTEAFLNSGSSLRFSSRFADDGERRVELKGEGFFKVAKDTRRPFIVSVGQLEVKALGTAFNINAYDQDSQIDVLLVEGKVAVDHKSGEGLTLQPGQLARYDVQANRLSSGQVQETDKYTGWMEGKMVFRDDPIRDVIGRMEIWYNVEFRIEGPLLERYRFTGTFIDEPLEEVLNILSMTSPLKYSIIPHVKNENGEYSKRKVILKQ